MKLYKISQTVNRGYDTYDSAVVCAEGEEEARKMHPGFYYYGYFLKDGHWWFRNVTGEKDEGELPKYFDWCKPQDVKVEYLGEAADSVPKGVVVGSFNAG